MALTNEQMLTEAREAYHALATGQAVAEVRDANGETIRYSKADISQLRLYIAELERTIAEETTPSYPMRILM